MRKGGKWYEGTRMLCSITCGYSRAATLNTSSCFLAIIFIGWIMPPCFEEHKAKGAKLTIACMEVPREQASAFGVMGVDDETASLRLLKTQ